MPTHELLRSQKNEVLLRVQQAGFDPSAFRWQEATSRKTQNLRVPQLLHEASRSYFRFDLLAGQHFCEYSPGAETVVQEEYPGSWQLQKEYVGLWLANLGRETGAPDLWSAFAEQNALFGDELNDAGEDNSHFSPAERARILQSVNEVRQYVAATSYDEPERLLFIQARLEYLIEASERLGRKDWRLVAIGVLTNIVIGGALAPDAAKDLLRLAGAALSWALGITPLIPHPLQ